MQPWTIMKRLAVAAAIGLSSCASMESLPPNAREVAACMAGVLSSVPGAETVHVTRGDSITGGVLNVEYSFRDQAGTRHRNKIGLNYDQYEAKDNWFFWWNQLTHLPDDPGEKAVSDWWTKCSIDMGVIA
jgi:hypothetical protein